LPGLVLADIHPGRITHGDDACPMKLNPRVRPPDLPAVPILRRDGSGVGFIFVHLSLVAPLVGGGERARAFVDLTLQRGAAPDQPPPPPIEALSRVRQSPGRTICEAGGIGL